jgi:hypothetical protein
VKSQNNISIRIKFRVNLRCSLHDVKVGEWCAMSAIKIIIEFILFLIKYCKLPSGMLRMF